MCVHLVKWCTKLLDFPLLMLANMFQGKDTQQKMYRKKKKKITKKKNFFELTLAFSYLHFQRGTCFCHSSYCPLLIRIGL